MRVLHAARAALIFFAATYALSLAVGVRGAEDDLVQAAYVAGILSVLGLLISSAVAVAAQLWLVLRRRIARGNIHG